MKYLLDTNICIHFFRGKHNLIERINDVGLNVCAISEITLAELVYGAESSSNPQKNYKLTDKFSEQVTTLPIFNAIHIYGKEKVRLRKNGEIISDLDLFIGSTSVANGLIMVTENVKEFKRISGIVIENWIK